MNDLLQIYFAQLEKHLVELARLAGVSSTQNQARGEGAEEAVAEIIRCHLPGRAAVTTHRQIIGADTGRDGVKPSYNVDVLVYNDWTNMSNLLTQGFILAESVYLAIEVKAFGDSPKLMGAIAEAATNQLPTTRTQKKRLRPETTYFGNVREKGKLPVGSLRTGMPTNGVLGILWEEPKQKVTAKRCLDIVGRRLKKKNGNSVLKVTDWPDFIYVPRCFLALKVVTNTAGKATRVYKDEYPFLDDKCKWPSGGAIQVRADSEEWKIEYRYLEVKNDLPNLLYAFIFWLSQEILKFGIEIPDYHRYLLPKNDPRLDDREGAMITPDGKWGLARFNNERDEWNQVFET